MRNAPGIAGLALACLVCFASPLAAQSAKGDDIQIQLLTRLDQYEAELRRLTAQVEELAFRSKQRAEQDDARIRDLEFRIIELEGGDPTEALRAKPAEAAPQAPASPAAPADKPTPPPATGVLRAPAADPGAAAAFEAAARDLDALGLESGQRSFEEFLGRYPNSPLAGDVYYRLGNAFYREGRYQEAARSFLAGMRDHATSPKAPENLVRLGETLAKLDQHDQACAAFAELKVRFPDASADVVDMAKVAAGRAGCS